ncbi:uncharacterized protein ACA1_067710 [Acanthamoeba castellanii str. Neff]|uniref:Uncharacterized protein n=1 Tax=Acanthamoeba castellanii (strain ATCC 30010 / Neff) TaxID=1257118 RepID=L8HD79_ACACF|nr:uncharacterized protein ACA1_067710 [Acanthamoeba castellanii str. Neff]ELR23187.1 hypothetical protein ACA1_067710 [Acanthamoeba castellanii str. Neff]
MEEVYGELIEVEVKQLAGSGHCAFYVMEWRSRPRGGITRNGTMFTKARRCWVYDPYSLDWEEHVQAGITDICVDSYDDV